MKLMCKVLVALAAIGAAGIASARGHGGLSIGFGFPISGPVYAAPPPVYYVQPRVVYVAPPPPVYYQPSYVYYAPPVTVYRPAPAVVYQSRERTEVVPAPSQPQPAAPALPPRAYRN